MCEKEREGCRGGRGRDIERERAKRGGRVKGNRGMKERKKQKGVGGERGQGRKEGGNFRIAL